MMSHYLQWHWITSGKKIACCAYHSELEWITAPDNGHLASPAALCQEFPTRLLGYETVMVQAVNNSRVIDWNQPYSFLIYMLSNFFSPVLFFSSSSEGSRAFSPDKSTCWTGLPHIQLITFSHSLNCQGNSRSTYRSRVLAVPRGGQDSGAAGPGPTQHRVHCWHSREEQGIPSMAWEQ